MSDPVRRLRRFGQNDEPVPPTPRCSHVVQSYSWREAQWREERYGADSAQTCTFPSVVEIDGKTYCRRHGGQVALDMLLDGRLVPR